jgi:hypothetical protein
MILSAGFGVGLACSWTLELGFHSSLFACEKIQCEIYTIKDYRLFNAINVMKI